MTEGSGESRLVSGRYRLGEALGRGGMGTVWRAVDELLRREVAVKEVRIPDDLDASEQEVRRERAMREARAAARVTHPNVVTIYDVVEDDGRPWIVMELVRARSLDEVIDHEGRLGPSEAAEVGLKVLAALRAARAADVLHRDVKPSNILLGADGRVILTDFGIATVLGSATLTATGMLIGSPEYLAPERVLGRRPGPASDLWSLGVTLYQAMEGRSPFQRTSAIETLTAVLQDEAAAPRYAGALAPALDALLRKDPDERPDEDAVEGLLTAALKGKSEHGTGTVAGAAAVAAGATAGATAVPPSIPAPPRPSDAFASAATVEDPHGALGATLGPGPGARSGPGSGPGSASGSASGSGAGSGAGSGSGKGAPVLGGAAVGAAAGAAAAGGTAYPPDGWPTGQQAPAGGPGGSHSWPTAAHGQAADSGPGGVGHPRSGDTPQPFPIGGFHGSTRPIEEDGRPGGAYPPRRRPRGPYAVLAGVAAALVAAAFWIVPSALGSNDKGGDGHPGAGTPAGASTVASPAAPSDNAVAGGVTVTPTTEQATYEPTSGQDDTDYTEPTKSAPKTTKPKPTTSRPTSSTTWPTTGKSPTTTPTGSTTSAGSGSSSGSGGATKSGAGSGSTAGAGAATKADATG